MSYKEFGNVKAVFANQDDALFSALPITMDENALTLEIDVRNGKRIVKAGSLVKLGTVNKGITAEEYDITDGATPGRVAIEGYVYGERLTETAMGAVDTFPKIVVIPYGKVIFAIESVNGNDVYIRVSGAVWASAVTPANISINAGATGATVTAVERQAEASLLKVSFGTVTADGNVEITAIAAGAVVGASGKQISGLPLTVAVEV